MPYKDPIVAKSKKRENYLANKDKFLARSKARRIRIQNERNLQKAAAAIGPQKPTKRLCKKCGIDITFTYNSKHGENCKSCVAAYHQEYRKANKERIALQKKAWVESNRDYKAEMDREYARSNPKARTAARNKWKASNPDKDRAAKAANRASRIMRVPSWSNREKVKAYYNVCAFFNEVNGYAKYHVDHIIPLNGKKVSGLHVHNNLQVILARDNLCKGNSHAI